MDCFEDFTTDVDPRTMYKGPRSQCLIVYLRGTLSLCWDRLSTGVLLNLCLAGNSSALNPVWSLENEG